jgi:hypothetical protein
VASAYSDANIDRFRHPINVQGVGLCQTGQRERTVSPTSLQLAGRAHHLDVRRRNTFLGRAATAQRLRLQVTAPNPSLPVSLAPHHPLSSFADKFQNLMKSFLYITVNLNRKMFKKRSVGHRPNS